MGAPVKEAFGGGLVGGFGKDAVFGGSAGGLASAFGGVVLGSFGIAFGGGLEGGIGGALAGGGVVGSLGPIAAALEVGSMILGGGAFAGSTFGNSIPCFFMTSNCARLLA